MYNPDDHPDHIEAARKAHREAWVNSTKDGAELVRELVTAVLAAVGPLIVRDALNEAADLAESVEWLRTRAQDDDNG